jgi:hypothetical protein
MAKKMIAAAVSGLMATAAGATVPPAYRDDLPPVQREGQVTYITGGIGHDEADAMKRAAQEYPLELVFVERKGRKENYLADMPVRIVDDKGKVVFEGQSEGPYFLARLPKGRYTVSTRWDAWSFSRPVTVGKQRQRVVFAWGKPSAPVQG